MRKSILACQTIEDELRLAMEETGINYPVYSIESGLHNKPDDLRRRIQQELNRIENTDIILMVFGYCGNSLLGVRADKAQLVVPKIDDCIPLLLGSLDDRKCIAQEMGTYFLTKGWLDYENNLLSEYERCSHRYGHSRALRVMKTMLGNYRRFMVIDTGAYPVEDVTVRTIPFAAELGLLHEVKKGSSRYLRKLLTGPWDDEFVTLEPGQELMLSDICMDHSGMTQLRCGTTNGSEV